MLGAWAVAAAQTRDPLLVDPQTRATLGVFEGPVALALEPGRAAGADPGAAFGLALVERAATAVVAGPGALGWASVSRPPGRLGATAGLAARRLSLWGAVDHAFAEVTGGEAHAVDARIELAAGGADTTAFAAWHRLAGTVDRVDGAVSRSGASTRLTPENLQDLLAGARLRRAVGSATLELSLAAGPRLAAVREVRRDVIAGPSRHDVVATDLAAAHGAASAWLWWEFRQGATALRLGLEGLADGVAGQRWVTATVSHPASGLGTARRSGEPELGARASVGFPLAASVALGSARLEGAVVPTFEGLTPSFRGALGLRVAGPTSLALVLDAPTRPLVPAAPELSIWLAGAPSVPRRNRRETGAPGTSGTVGP